MLDTLPDAIYPGTKWALASEASVARLQHSDISNDITNDYDEGQLFDVRM